MQAARERESVQVRERGGDTRPLGNLFVCRKNYNARVPPMCPPPMPDNPLTPRLPLAVFHIYYFITLKKIVVDDNTRPQYVLGARFEGWRAFWPTTLKGSEIKNIYINTTKGTGIEGMSGIRGGHSGGAHPLGYSQ